MLSYRIMLQNNTGRGVVTPARICRTGACDQYTRAFGLI